jgi:hypothetical protein
LTDGLINVEDGSQGRSMTTTLASKYGTALTGSDWVGLPLRIGHIPDSGCLEDLSTDTDAVLVWSGGPSFVTIRYRKPKVEETAKHSFERVSGMMDLLPRGTKLHRVDWQGKPSVCTSVNLPEPTVQALTQSPGGLSPEHGPQFGLVDGHVVDLVSRLQVQAAGTEYLGAVYVQSLSLTLASYLSARYGTRPPKPLTDQQRTMVAWTRQAGAALGLDLKFQASGGVCEGNNLAAAGCPNIDTLGPCGGALHSDEEFALIPSFAERAKLSFLLLAGLDRGVFDVRSLRS